MGWKFEKDGVTIKDYFAQTWPHVRRLVTFERGISDFGHAFVNVFVEACRLSAYHSGHFWAVQTALTIILLCLACIK